ncbi:MAG: S8 family peptidase [Candidatus Cloacimonadota bacterium]
MKSCLILILSFVIFELGAFTTERYESGRLYIKLRSDYYSQSSRAGSGTGISSLDSRLYSLGISEIKASFNPKLRTEAAQALSLIYELKIDPSLSPLAIINALAEDQHLDFAEPVFIHDVLDVPDDPRYAECLNLPSVSAEAAWSIHKCGSNPDPVLIAIVDTGMRWDHVDLAENVWHNLGEDFNGNGYTMYHNGTTWVMDAGDINGLDDDGNGFVDDLIGWDFMLDLDGNQANNPTDPGSHGTRVSGLAGARTNNAIGTSSLSWNPKLMAISCSPPGATSSIYRGYEAIVYAAENGADIINCSWGSTGYSQIGQLAIDYAYSLGAIIVAAAGNSNNSIPIYPAAYQNVVATAALNNDGTRWSGSNFGGYVDLAAPCQSVVSTSGTGYSTIGPATSYASPVASAAMALVKSYNPAWTQEEIILQLVASSDDIDHLNPGKENLLGEGKINALSALTAIDPVLDQELHLGLIGSVQPNDDNMNLAVEPGESFSLSLLIRNFSWGVGADDATFTLSSTNPVVNISDPTHMASIPADGYLPLNNVFWVTVDPLAQSQYVSFTLSTVADKPILSGASLTFSILIHNGGVFVWEASSGARDLSGTYIRNTLQSLSYPVVYGTAFPSSFLSFDMVFLSFGTPGGSIFRLSDPVLFGAIRTYLESGGRLYLEGGDVLGWDIGYYMPDLGGGEGADDILWPLLGIDYAVDGSTNVIDGLAGHSPLPTSGMLFSASNQVYNTTIDLIYPLRAQAATAFTESDYGPVAVISAGAYDQRSFVMSYALAELSDGDFPNTRANLLGQILDFFEAEEVTLPVELSSFTAIWNGAAVLNWITASETQVLGYNIYRSELPILNQALKINSKLIQAAGTSSQTQYYSFEDPFVESSGSWNYWLESVCLDGSSEQFGPIELRIPDTDPEMPPPSVFHTRLISAHPNPFGHTLSCRYELADKASVQFRLYNMRGQVVYSSQVQDKERGEYYHNIEFSAGPGIYILELQTGEVRFQRKLLKL